MWHGTTLIERHTLADRIDPQTSARVEELLARARAGDQAAWDELVERYGQLVWGTIRTHGLVAADAADASQVTWLLLGQHLDELDSGRLGRWLAATATREASKVRLLRAAEARAGPCPDEVAD
jgi:DNA-directed RNA polymerase specialized sigma24 family protein